MRCLSLAIAAVGSLFLAAVARGEEDISHDVLAGVKNSTVFVKVQAEGQAVSGSGFVVKADDGVAYIVTNHHVIEPKLKRIVAEWHTSPGGPRGPSYPRGPRRYGGSVTYLTPREIVRTLRNATVTVVFRSGTPQEQAVPAEVLVADPDVDLAVLKAKDVKNVPAALACCPESALGEMMTVYTFGFPFGEVLATNKGNPAITVGKAAISSLRRNEAGELVMVQIDGALNPGNSGGPLVDRAGRLIGVAVATIIDSSGIGLAIPGRQVPEMLLGRLGKPQLHTATDSENGDTIEVEVGLIDPFHNIKTATLYYLATGKLPAKSLPTDQLKALSGCHRLALTIEDRLAVGKIHLKKGVAGVSLCCQAGYRDAAGPERFTAKVEETLGPQEKPRETAVVQSPPRYRPTPTTPPPTPPGTAPKAADLPQLVADIESGDLGRRLRSIVQLMRTKPTEPNPAVAKALSTALLEDGNESIRSIAATALQSWGTKESLPALKKALKDPSPGIRFAAQRAIEAIDPSAKEAKPARHSMASPLPLASTDVGPKTAADLTQLVEELNSGDTNQRRHAMTRLMRTKPQDPDPTVAKALTSVLLEDGDDGIRMTAARALEYWGRKESLPALKKALKDPSRLVQHGAQKAIDAIKLREEE